MDPAPPEADHRHIHRITHGRKHLQVEALLHPVGVDAVENDLSGAAADAVPDPCDGVQACILPGRPLANTRNWPSTRLASTERTTHWSPYFRAAFRIREGSRIAPELTLTLSAPHLRTRSKSSTVLIPPPTVRGMKMVEATSVRISVNRAPTFSRGGDVVEHQLVGATVAVELGQLHWAGYICQPQEVDPLHHPAVLHVKARDDTLCDYGATSCSPASAAACARSMAPAYQALPDDGGVEAHISQSADILITRDAAGGGNGAGHRLLQLCQPPQRGAGEGPSVSISVKIIYFTLINSICLAKDR